MRKDRSTWYYLLGAFVLLIVFQGALRKWALPAYSRYLYFLKDAVLALAITGFVFQRRIAFPKPVAHTILPVLLGISVGWTALEAFNLRLPNVWVGLLGMRSHLLYVALSIMIPAALVRVRNPARLVWGFIIGVVVPVLLLGIYQYFQAPSAWINKYVAEEAQITEIAGHARITGTFSYITGMSTFLVLSLCLAVGTLFAGVRLRRRRLVLAGAVLLALSVTVSPMNGSRSVLFFTAVPVPVVLFEMMRQYGRRSMAITGVAATVVIALLATQTDLALAWETFLGRVEGANDTESRAVGLFLGPYRRLGDVGFFGFGAGSTHQAAPLLAGAPHSTWLPFGGHGESTFDRLLTELGAIGFIFVMGLKVYLVYFAYRTMRNARSAFAAVMGTAAFLFLAVHLVAHVAFNPTAGALYWTLVGTVIYAWSWDEVEKSAAQRIRHDQLQPA